MLYLNELNYYGMLEILLVIYIGRWFYRLAEKHNKNKWLVGILGALSFYAFILISGFLMGVVFALMENEAFFELPDIVIGLLCIPFAIFGTWGLYRILKNSWERLPKTSDRVIDDGGL